MKANKTDNDNDKCNHLYPEISKHCINKNKKSDDTYNMVMFGLIMELEDLPENNKEGTSSIN